MSFIKKNKFLSAIFIFLILITSISLLEMISIGPKYLNQPTVTFSVNNVRNPQIKKIVRFLDSIYGKIYFSLSTKQNKKFEVNESFYNTLPDKVYIEGITNKYTNSNGLNKNNLNEWHRSHGNHSSNRFSDLKEINLTNVDDLDLAWIHKFDEIGGIQANPIFAEGLIFMPSTSKSIVAINAINGKKVLKSGELHNSNHEITSKKLHPDWVSRGAIKLLHAIEYFKIDVSDYICLDIGASTGGFTEVLIKKNVNKQTIFKKKLVSFFFITLF